MMSHRLVSKFLNTNRMHVSTPNRTLRGMAQAIFLAQLRNLMKRSTLLVHSLVICSILWPQIVSANPCTTPKRMINSYTVDLQPLFDWWPAPKGMRPLSGWKHVRGAIARETAYGWVVIGKAEGQNHAPTFLLKNPPQEKLRRFQELKRQLPEYEHARAATLEFLKRPTLTDWYSFWSTQPSLPPISLAEYRNASALLSGLDRNMNALHNQLASMQDEQGNFKLDAFALRLNETYEGIPVFDHGFSH